MTLDDTLRQIEVDHLRAVRALEEKRAVDIAAFLNGYYNTVEKCREGLEYEDEEIRAPALERMKKLQAWDEMLTPDEETSEALRKSGVAQMSEEELIRAAVKAQKAYRREKRKP